MKKHLKALALILTVLILVAMSGCSSIITKEDLEDLEDQLSELEDQLEDLEDQVDELKDNSAIQIAQESDTTTASQTTEQETEEITTQDPNTESEVTASAFDEDAVLGMLETTEYAYHSDYSSYALLVIKNNSQYDLSLYGEMIFKDSDGALVGTVSSQTYAFEAGQETLMEFYSSDDFASFEYSLSADEETYYAPILSSLEKEVSMTDSKAVLSVTNNADMPAQYVQFYALFFSGDDLVYYDWGYCTDDDSEIKPGKTNYAQARSYEDFDSVLVYLSGRAEK